MHPQVKIMAENLLSKRPDLTSAYELAAELHSEQSRPGAEGREPYILHPLRNTLRLMEWGVSDLELLQASLLHDTVEDCAVRYAKLEGLIMEEEDARVLLAGHIESVFGTVVKQYILSVTNPLPALNSPELSKAEKHRVYQVGVRHHIEDNAAVLLIKLADWMDNAGSLSRLPQNKHAMAVSLAGKYLPLATDFFHELLKDNMFLDSQATTRLNWVVLDVAEELKELLRAA